MLVGWYENADKKHLAWIRASGLHNLRAGDRNGSIRLEPRITGEKQLSLHVHGGNAHQVLRRVKRAGPRLFTAEELLAQLSILDPVFGKIPECDLGPTRPEKSRKGAGPPRKIFPVSKVGLGLGYTPNSSRIPLISIKPAVTLNVAALSN